MPWTASDAATHIKGLNDSQAAAWAKIANTALSECQGKGGSDCEGYAIRVANAKAKQTAKGAGVDVVTVSPKVGFVQFAKFNADTGEFEGVMASEAPDGDKEIFDYATSKPYFKSWVETSRSLSDGKSVGNVREMHTNKAVGKLTAVAFDDDGKRLTVKGKLVDADARTKASEGVLTGLSIGGDYVKRWMDPQDPKYTRYTAKPHEVSVVDFPCNPDAKMTLVAKGVSSEVALKGHPEIVTFEEDADPSLLKAQTKSVGGVEHPASAFAYVGDQDDVSTWKYPIFDASHARNALARWGQEKDIPAAEKPKVFARIKAAAKKHGVDVSEKSEKVIKSLYDVGGIAQQLSSIDFLRSCLASEAANELDNSPIPAKLLEIEVQLAQVLKEVAAEEADELLALAGATREDDMSKIQDTLAELATLSTAAAEEMKLAKAATHDEKKGDHHEKMADLHEKMAKAHDAMAEHYGQDPHADGDEAEKATKAPVTKAIDEDALTAKITENVVKVMAAIFAPTEEEGKVVKVDAASAISAPQGRGAATPVLKSAPDAAKVDAGEKAIVDLPSVAVLKARIRKGEPGAQEELDALLSQQLTKKIRTGGLAGFTGYRVAK